MTNPLEGFSAPRKTKMQTRWKVAIVIAAVVGAISGPLVQQWLAKRPLSSEVSSSRNLGAPPAAADSSSK